MSEPSLDFGRHPSDTTASATAAEQVADVLRQRILSGQMAGGTPVRQEALAGEFGLSRLPVRDAIRILIAERLLVARPRQGAAVAELTIHDLQELYDFRLAIEPALSRLAVSNLHRANVLMMEEQLKVTEGAKHVAAWIEANDRFHWLLYSESGRPWMIEMLDQARQRTGRYTRIKVAGLTSDPLNRQHRKILDAVIQRDGEALEVAVREHLRAGYDWVLRRLLETQAPA